MINSQVYLSFLIKRGPTTIYLLIWSLLTEDYSASNNVIQVLHTYKIPMASVDGLLNSLLFYATYFPKSSMNPHLFLYFYIVARPRTR